MRFLRVTGYSSMVSPPMTVITRECDTDDTLESLAQHMFDEPEGFPNTARPLMITHISDLDTDDLVAGTEQIMSRVDAHSEQNMAVMYFYLVEHVLPMLKAGGWWMAPDPAPLTAEEVEIVFRQVAMHGNYDDQTCTTRVADGRTTVEMRDGKIEVIR